MTIKNKINKKKIRVKMWRIAIPAIFANISIPLLGLADTYIMGHLPSAKYLAAVTIGAMVASLILNSFNFLRMATTGFTAQAFGRKNNDEISLIFLRASLTAVIIGSVLILFQYPISYLIYLLGNDQTEINNLALEYFNIRIWGAPFTLANFVAVGWLLGLGKAREVLIIHLFLNLSNIALNFLFVLHFNMTADGVALGTVLAEIMCLILSLFMIRANSKKYMKRSLYHPDRLKMIWQKSAFKKFFSLNFNIFIRTLCLTSIMAYFIHLGGRFGTEILAANAILMHLQMVTSFALDGFAQAAEVLVGKEIGRKSLKNLRYSIMISSKWAVIFSFIIAISLYLGENLLIHGLTDIEALRPAAHKYYIWVVFLPLISVASFQLDGIFIGAIRGVEMRNGMIISTLCFIIASTYAIEKWHNHGLWFSYSIFLLMRGMTLLYHYPKIERSIKK